MNYYSWMDSTACLCSQAMIVAMQNSADAAESAVLWTLGGISCLFMGALLGSVQGTGDLVLMTADFNYMRVSRRRSTTGSPTRRTYTDFLQTPASMLKNQPSTYQMNARSAGPNLTNRSPTGVSYMER
jgi:hypothetical protein